MTCKIMHDGNVTVIACSRTKKPDKKFHAQYLDESMFLIGSRTVSADTPREAIEAAKEFVDAVCSAKTVAFIRVGETTLSLMDFTDGA